LQQFLMQKRLAGANRSWKALLENHAGTSRLVNSITSMKFSLKANLTKEGLINSPFVIPAHAGIQ